MYERMDTIQQYNRKFDYDWISKVGSGQKGF